MRRLVTAITAILLAAGAAQARPAVDAIYGLPPVAEVKDRRCTADGLHCISVATYVPDVCRAIERAAK